MERGILASRDELESLAGIIDRKPFSAIYDVLRRRCDLILQSAPIPDTQWSRLWEQGRRGAAVQAAKTTQGRIFDLAIAHHIDPNVAYRDRAIEEIDVLSRWQSWTDPSNLPLPADLCTAEAAVAAIVGLDWLWEDLTESKRRCVLEAIRDKAIAPYLQGVREKAWWYDCYHNWNAVVNSGCGLAALALAKGDEQAARAHEAAIGGLKHFFDALGSEGGWDEGVGYWGYAMRYVLLLGEATARLLDDERIFHRRGMEKTGLFAVHFCPNGRPAGFRMPMAVPLYGTFYLLAKRCGLKEMAWWLDTYAFHRDVGISGWSSAGLGLVFRPRNLPEAKKIKLKPVKAFGEIGWAAMADQWPRPSMYVAVKTGDMAAHHGRRDMNCLHLQVDGELLLANVMAAGEREPDRSRQADDFGDVQAALHNTIVVAQRDHQIDARGSLLVAESGKDFRWVCCDAAEACGPSVRFIRHAVMVPDAGGDGWMLVVVDELTNAVPERVDLFWHSGGRIRKHPGLLSGTISGESASVNFALASTVKLRVEIESRKLNNHLVDSAVHVTAGVLDSALFASVFGRGDVDGAAIETQASGDVRIAAGGRKILFASGAGHLKFAKVE